MYIWERTVIGISVHTAETETATTPYSTTLYMASPQTIRSDRPSSVYPDWRARNHMIRECTGNQSDRDANADASSEDDVGATRNHVSSWSLAQLSLPVIELLTLSDIREPSLVCLSNVGLLDHLQISEVVSNANQSHVPIFLCRAETAAHTASARGMVRDPHKQLRTECELDIFRLQRCPSAVQCQLARKCSEVLYKVISHVLQHLREGNTGVWRHRTDSPVCVEMRADRVTCSASGSSRTLGSME